MNLFRREQIEILIPLVMSWLVYAVCQRDGLAVLLAMGAVCFSYGYQRFQKSPLVLPAFFEPSFRMLGAVGLMAGILWRLIFPAPEESVSFLPVLLPGLQTALVFVSVFIWLRFRFRWRTNTLNLLAWMTVALSVNVPFQLVHYLAFGLFCLSNIGLWVLQIYWPPSVEVNVGQGPGQRTLKMFASAIAFFVLLIGLFVFMIGGIHFGDDVLTRLMRDYMVQRSFKFFDALLRLNGPGGYPYAVKPVLEVDRGNQEVLYLAGQVFESYTDGVWKAASGRPRRPLSASAWPSAMALRLRMYEFFENVIPAPRWVEAISSKKGSFEKDFQGIVFNTEDTMPQVTLWVTPAEKEPALLSFALRQRLTTIDPLLAQALVLRTGQILGELRDPRQIPEALEQYFRQNFQYTLNVNFIANDFGLLYMLDRRQPAYCSYFASAMTLMLRAHRIPARLVTGFMAREVSRWDQNKFMVRGRDAHAWVEVWIPLSGEIHAPASVSDPAVLGQWVRFDPTPPASRSFGELSVNQVADFLWCLQKRFFAFLLEIEPVVFVKGLVGILLFVLLQESLKGLVQRFLARKKTKKASDKTFGGMPEDVLRGYYRSFEKYLARACQISMDLGQTHEELLPLLRNNPAVPKEMVLKIEDWLSRYQAVRFGGRPMAILKEDAEKFF